MPKGGDKTNQTYESDREQKRLLGKGSRVTEAEKYAWSRLLAAAVGSMYRILSPIEGECALCRRHARLKSVEFGICTNCFQSIPWIRDVHCPVCGRYERCGDCSRRTNAFVSSRSAVQYDPSMKELLARYKYRGDERLRKVLGHMLLHAYRLHQEAPEQPAKRQRRLITYVPVSEKRLLERGFNQAEQMAGELGKRLRLPVVSLLRRVKHTDKQSLKSRQGRLKELSGAFEVDRAQALKLGSGKPGVPETPVIIYIVDDVYTTGSTIQECAAVIKECIYSHVYGITWAR